MNKAASLDLSHNEACAALALALEGGGLPQGLTRALARHAIDTGQIEAALTWRREDVPNLLPALLAPPPPNARARRQSMPPALWARIKALAAHTYVPESESSRQSGAGAGEKDDD